MTKAGQNITTFLSTIPILIVCGIIIFLDSNLDKCYGLIPGLSDLFLFLILVLLLLLFLIRQIYKIATNSDNKKSRIFLSIIVIALTLITFCGKSIWKELRLGSSILKASIYLDQLDIGRIELLKEKKYYALYGHIDWTCAYTDNYEIRDDTLILSGNPFEKTDGILTDKYIMTDSLLIPVKTKDRDMTRTAVMTIEDKN